MQQRDLATGTAEALHAVRRRRDQQHLARIRRAHRGHVDGKLLALRAACGRMHVAGHGQAARAGGGEELVARVGVSGGESGMGSSGIIVSSLRRHVRGPHGERHRRLDQRREVAGAQRDHLVVEIVTAVVQEAAALRAALPRRR